MKLVVAVVHSDDADACCDALTGDGFICTRFASAGGFLDNSNATLLIGVDDAQVDQVLDSLRSRARTRVEALESPMTLTASLAPVMAPPVEVEVGGATIFVLPVERFEKL